MKNYAMLLLGFVIDIVEEVIEPPNYPPDSEGNPVFAVECDSSVAIGMIYKNGRFCPYIEPFEIYKPTEGELILMEAQATMYEEMHEITIVTMEANADIYEAILSIGGDV